MQIHVSGKHMELGDSFQEYVESRLKEGVSKYIDRVNHLEVVATKEGHRIRVDVHTNIGTHSHLAVNGRAEAADVYAAFDAAAEKIEKQLRRYKRKITNHHREREGKEDAALLEAKHYVLSSDHDKEELAEDYAPAVIAERADNLETLTVSEAVMKLDLGGLPALMFYNSAHGRLNVVYRRDDGHIAWVDPQAVLAAKAA